MKQTKQIGILTLFIFLAACGSSTHKDEGSLEGKKARLTQMRKQQDSLGAAITQLENDIAKVDSSFAIKPKLVSVTALASQNFTHYIDLQGRITTKQIYYISPRGTGGQVKAVYVKEGERVKKGQL